MGSALFDWLVATSWQVALLVLAVALVQRVLGRWLTPRWRYALWCLVVLRLFLPAQPEMPAFALDWERASFDVAGEREVSSNRPAGPVRRLAPRIVEDEEAAAPGEMRGRAAGSEAPRVRAVGAERRDLRAPVEVGGGSLESGRGRGHGLGHARGRGRVARWAAGGLGARGRGVVAA